MAVNKYPKPSGQAFRPTHPNRQCPNVGGVNAKWSSLSGANNHLSVGKLPAGFAVSTALYRLADAPPGLPVNNVDDAGDNDFEKEKPGSWLNSSCCGGGRRLRWFQSEKK